MRGLWLFAALTCPAWAAGPFPPAAGLAGSTAVSRDDPGIVAWATGYQDLVRGPLRIDDLSEGYVTQGTGADALGYANSGGDTATTFNVVSLGDGGQITLTFDHPIGNGPGPDFAVFENGFLNTFLELAFVEVSDDGTNFVRFPAVSATQSGTQVGPFDPLDATYLNNLAGKYRRYYGTPFDLAELSTVPNLDLQDIVAVRVIDVIGSIDPQYGSQDSLGNYINDPFPTDFDTGGFDLDAVSVMHLGVPEPGAMLLCAAGTAALSIRRKRRTEANP